MGIMTAVDIFQQEISMLFNDAQFIKIYLDGILIVSYKDNSDHLDKLAQVLQRLLEANLKIKHKNVNFYRNKSNV